jgi:hypothetical protein
MIDAVIDSAYLRGGDDPREFYTQEYAKASLLREQVIEVLGGASIGELPALSFSYGEFLGGVTAYLETLYDGLALCKGIRMTKQHKEHYEDRHDLKGPNIPMQIGHIGARSKDSIGGKGVKETKPSRNQVQRAARKLDERYTALLGTVDNVDSAEFEQALVDYELPHRLSSSPNKKQLPSHLGFMVTNYIINRSITQKQREAFGELRSCMRDTLTIAPLSELLLGKMPNEVSICYAGQFLSGKLLTAEVFTLVNCLVVGWSSETAAKEGPGSGKRAGSLSKARTAVGAKGDVYSQQAQSIGGFVAQPDIPFAIEGGYREVEVGKRLATVIPAADKREHAVVSRQHPNAQQFYSLYEVILRHHSKKLKARSYTPVQVPNLRLILEEQRGNNAVELDIFADDRPLDKETRRSV